MRSCVAKPFQPSTRHFAKGLLAPPKKPHQQPKYPLSRGELLQLLIFGSTFLYHSVCCSFFFTCSRSILIGVIRDILPLKPLEPSPSLSLLCALARICEASSCECQERKRKNNILLQRSENMKVSPCLELFVCISPFGEAFCGPSCQTL